jgi:hypothetical protein
VKTKEQTEFMDVLGRRLREAADAGQALPKAVRASLEILRNTESRATSEMSQPLYRAGPGRRTRAPK